MALGVTSSFIGLLVLNICHSRVSWIVVGGRKLSARWVSRELDMGKIDCPTACWISSALLLWKDELLWQARDWWHKLSLGKLSEERGRSRTKQDPQFMCVCVCVCVCACVCSGVPRGVWGGSNTPPPEILKFWQAEPDCKLSEKCLVFLFQHPN